MLGCRLRLRSQQYPVCFFSSAHSALTHCIRPIHTGKAAVICRFTPLSCRRFRLYCFYYYYTFIGFYFSCALGLKVFDCLHWCRGLIISTSVICRALFAARLKGAIQIKFDWKERRSCSQLRGIKRPVDGGDTWSSDAPRSLPVEVKQPRTLISCLLAGEMSPSPKGRLFSSRWRVCELLRLLF